MAVTQYIGARYVPMFADPIDWDSTKEYEPLTIVTYQGASYTSRQSVPAGVSITDQNYWVLTGNYNAQVSRPMQAQSQPLMKILIATRKPPTRQSQQRGRRQVTQIPPPMRPFPNSKRK